MTILDKPFIDLGPRNKGTFWEYCSAYSFLRTRLPDTMYTIPDFLGVAKGALNHHCHHKNIIAKARELMLEEFKAGLYTDEFFEALDQAYVSSYKQVQLLLAKPLPTDKDELIALLSTVFRAFTDTHKPMLMGLYTMYLQPEFEALLDKALGFGESREERMAVLLHPDKLTFIQKEEQALMKLVRSFPVKDLSVHLKGAVGRVKLDQLAKDFGWFHMEYSKEPWSAQDYERYILERQEELRNKALPSEILERVVGAQKRFAQTHAKHQELIAFAHMLRQFSFILDHSKEVVVHEFFLATTLLENVAVLLGVSKNDLLYLVYPEIIRLLQSGGKAPVKLIDERKQYRAVLLKEGRITVHHGDAAKDLLDLIDTGDRGSDQIKGIAVCPGVVEGKVCVVASEADRAKFTPGDVLVTHDGSAELTYFLKNASAIVTNVGGMICHAAIVARELKTPCVVGSGNATRLLKDGDRVLVDGTKGVVRKLE